MVGRLILVGSLPLLVLGLLIAGLGVPVPEDPLLLAAGVLCHRTAYPSWLVLPVVYASAIGADCGLYALARRFGEPLLLRRPFRWFVTKQRREHVRALFTRHGAQAVFIGRHLSGLRTLVFMLSGIEKMPFAKFLLWDGLAGLVTIPAVFGLGYLFSSHVAAVEQGLARVEHWAAAVAGLAALLGWVLWSRRRHAAGPSPHA
jgi:membrane protein DedA with SNARE-associated domain